MEGEGATGGAKAKTPKEKLDEMLDGGMLNDLAEMDPPPQMDA